MINIFLGTRYTGNLNKESTIYNEDIKPSSQLNITEEDITTGGEEDIFSLNKYYILKNPEEIRNFLFENDYLIPVLYVAPEFIKKYFPDSQIELEVYRDPEIPEWKRLFVYIVVKVEPEEALEIMNKLEDEWWLDAMVKTKGKMGLLFKYV